MLRSPVDVPGPEASLSLDREQITGILTQEIASGSQRQGSNPLVASTPSLRPARSRKAPTVVPRILHASDTSLSC